jgi:replicative DNA helicase
MQSDPLSEQGFPAAIDTEKAILGSITLNNELIAQAIDLLEADEFYLDSHKRIFDAMASLHECGNPIDSVTLPALLIERKELEQVGGVTYLASLIDGVPQTDDVEFYCQIVKYKARERYAITELNYELSQLMDGEEELDAILERAQSKLAKICEGGRDDRAITGVYSSLDTFFAAEFEEPEQILFGVHRGEVAGLMAVTNYGKSTLLYNTTLSIAAGERLWPLASIVPKPRRVLYVDSESPASRAKADLQTMIRGISNGKASPREFRHSSRCND